MQQQQYRVPTLVEIQNDLEQAFRNDQLNLLLNQPPPAPWIKQHPLITVKNEYNQTVPLEYLPIDKIEMMLLRIFQKYRIEVLSTVAMFNSITVTVRLHYQRPDNLEWHFHDGVGASNVQTNKGKSAADLAEIKSSAVQMALPSAKSYAIKDAAEHLGKLFGRDLNRKGTIAFSGAYEQPPAEPQPEVPTNNYTPSSFNQKEELPL